MAKAKTFIILFLALFISHAHAHVDAAIDIQLVGGRELIVIFDAYMGYSRERNLVNAATIAHAIKNLARSAPGQKITFSYEDPSVYDAGSLLIDKLVPLKYLISGIEANKFLALVAPVSGVPRFDALSFARPLALTTFLTGDLTHILASLPKSFWPENLSIHSNDPRNEHVRALVKSQYWLLRHQNTLRMKTLITASPLLKAKRRLFDIDPNIELASREKILKFIKDFASLEQSQLAAFANFASIKARATIEVADLDKSIGELSPIVNLDTVSQFLKDTKKAVDIYADGPLVDILLTLFGKQHPDKTIVILGNHRATRLVKLLDDMGVIISGQDIPDAESFIARLAVDPKASQQAEGK